MSRKGFTLVELMIVIAIIGILAAVLYPAMGKYFGRARDAKRYQDIAHIEKALANYNIDTSRYPQSNLHAFSNVEPNGAWVNSSHSGSWKSLETQLKNYLPNLPTDPINTQGPGGFGWWSTYLVYSYFSVSSFCNGTPAYVLVYSLEVSTPRRTDFSAESCPDFYNYTTPDGHTLITIGEKGGY